MRRPRRKLEVNTFPFLAVLLCAMGSFILVLMIIDRRGKIVAQNKVRETYLARKIAYELDRDERIAAAQDQSAKNKAAWQAQKDKVHADLQVEEDALARQITQVLAALAKSDDVVTGQNAAATTLAQKVNLEDAALRALQNELQSRQDQLKQAKKTSQGHLQLREQLTRDLVVLEAALRNVQERKARERPVYSLVPYKGKHGASSKPIYVEVSEGTVAVHPGPTVVSAATWSPETLRRAIEERTGPLEREVARRGLPPDDNQKNPYLLFLVRPAGIPIYYDALKFLGDYRFDFGYELIEPDWVFDFSTDAMDQQPWRNVARLNVEPSNVTRPAPKGMGPRVLGPGGGPVPFSGANAVPGAKGVSDDGSMNRVGPTASQQPGAIFSGGAGSALPGSVGAPGQIGPAGFGNGGSGGASNGVGPAGAPTAGELQFRASQGGPVKLGGPPFPTGTGPGGAGNSGAFGAGGPAKDSHNPGGLSSPNGAGTDNSPVIGMPPSANSPRTEMPPNVANVGRPTGGVPPSGFPSAASGAQGGYNGNPGTPFGSASRAGERAPGNPGGSGVNGPSPPLPGQGNFAGHNSAGNQGGNITPPQSASGGIPDLTFNLNGQKPATQPGGRSEDTSPRDVPPQGMAPNQANALANPGPPGSSRPGDVDIEEAGPRYGNTPFLSKDKVRPGPRLPAIGRITGNRDFVMTVECYEHKVSLSPPGKTFDLNDADAVEQLANLMKSLVAGRQRTVRAGEPPYRPVVHFRVQPDGRRTYYSVYPRIADFGYPMSRETPD
jgi:hypothetical protein